MRRRRVPLQEFRVVDKLDCPPRRKMPEGRFTLDCGEATENPHSDATEGDVSAVEQDGQEVEDPRSSLAFLGRTGLCAADEKGDGVYDEVVGCPGIRVFESVESDLCDEGNGDLPGRPRFGGQGVNSDAVTQRNQENLVAVLMTLPRGPLVQDVRERAQNA